MMQGHTIITLQASLFTARQGYSCFIPITQVVIISKHKHYKYTGEAFGLRLLKASSRLNFLSLKKH